MKIFVNKFFKKNILLILLALVLCGCTHTYQVSEKFSLQHQIKPNTNILLNPKESPLQNAGVQAKYQF